MRNLGGTSEWEGEGLVGVGNEVGKGLCRFKVYQNYRNITRERETKKEEEKRERKKSIHKRFSDIWALREMN